VQGLGRAEVHVVALSRNAGATARNVGVRLARTPLVAFADDDSWWEPGALGRAAALFARYPRLGLLAAHVLLEPSGRPDPVCDVMAASPLGSPGHLPGPEVLGFVACAAVVRREAFLAAGGFDPVVFFAGEEERLAIDLASAGWGLAYAAEVVAHHRPARSRDPHPRRAAMIARNRLLTAVMRRPWTVVAQSVRRDLRGPATARAGAAAAVLRLPLALAWRRRVPAEVEQALRLLDAPLTPLGAVR
jgi:GT2 family glycosyltransferase